MRMNHVSVLKTAAGIALLVCTQAAPAASFYRCGSSYQDTPCASAGGNNKTIKSSAKTTSSVSSNDDLQQFAKIDADCKQRGDATKKISWAREGGKTLDQQLESAKDGHTQALMRDVYNHRGSSLDVRNAIEQECMQQKEQDKLADKLIIEAQKIRGNRNTGTGNLENSKAQLNPTSDEINIKETKTSDAESRAKPDDNKTRCSGLKTDAEDVATQRRRGGDANYMNYLKQKQDKIESQLKAAGC